MNSNESPLVDSPLDLTPIKEALIELSPQSPVSFHIDSTMSSIDDNFTVAQTVDPEAADSLSASTLKQDSSVLPTRVSASEKYPHLPRSTQAGLDQLDMITEVIWA